MDEVILAQTKYISSKRASRLTGYAQDYIGQLVRMNKITATKVGKAWFVDEAALMRHVNGSDRLPAPVKGLAALEVEKAQKHYSSAVTAGIRYPATWSNITYLTDNESLLPISDSRDSLALNSKAGHESPEALSDSATNRPITIVSTRGGVKSAPVGGGSRVVKAFSVDGVRFEAPVRALEQELPIMLVQSSAGSDGVGRFSTLSYVMRVCAGAVVAGVVIFFVPIIM